jgi:hypothetical protein
MRRYGESTQHERGKERVGNILRAQGWRVWIDTYSFECQTDKGPRTYWPDVYAESEAFEVYRRSDLYQNQSRLGEKPPGARRIIVEIQGKGGHNTKLARSLDDGRLQDIRQSHGPDIEYFELFNIRGWSDQDIREELYLSGVR